MTSPTATLPAKPGMSTLAHLEGAVAVVEEDDLVAAAGLHGHEVEIAVEIEVAGGDGAGPVELRIDFLRGLEGAVAVAPIEGEERRILEVHHEVEMAVASEVLGQDASGEPAGTRFA